MGGTSKMKARSEERMGRLPGAGTEINALFFDKKKVSALDKLVATNEIIAKNSKGVQ